MSRQSTTYFSASSTFTAKRGPGTAYGVTVASAPTGGTVTVLDLADLVTNPPNAGVPSTFGPAVVASFGPFAAGTQGFDASLQGRQLSSGLLVSVTSTSTVTVHFD